MKYLAEDVDVVVVVLVLLLVLIVEDHFLLSLVNGGLEDLIRPWVLLAPVVFLVLVLEVMVADIRISVGDADVDAFILQYSWYFPEHLLGVLLGVGSTLHYKGVTSKESSMPLSMTQSKVSFSKTPFRFLASAWMSGWGGVYIWRCYRSHCSCIWAACPPPRSLRSRYWWYSCSRPHTSPRWRVNFLSLWVDTCANV